MRQVSHDPAAVQANSPVQQFADHAAFQAQSVACNCGWRGLGRQAERGRLYDIGVEVLCPACTRRLGVALFEAEPDDAGQVGLPAPYHGHLDPGLARMLDLFAAMTPADHERAQVLMASGLPLTRKAWIEAFFSGHDADSLPAQIEAHLPRPLARR